MTPEQQRIAIAEACGWKDIFTSKHGDLWGVRAGQEAYGPSPVPHYLNDLNAIHAAEVAAGVHDINNPAMRGKWMNSLRKAVEHRCPRNKVNVPVISDADIMMASAAERAEGLLRFLGLWKNEG